MITPPHLVEASYETTILEAPAEKVLYFGYNGDDLYAWCSDTDGDDHYIIIHFSQPVFITSFLSSGSTNHASGTLDTFYVTNFTLEYTNTSGDFIYYTTFGGNRKVGYHIPLEIYYCSPNMQYFNQSEPVALFRLERPIVTNDIRFRPIQWSDDSGRQFFQYICLGVALFGCTEEESETIKLNTCSKRIVIQLWRK